MRFQECAFKDASSYAKQINLRDKRRNVDLNLSFYDFQRQGLYSSCGEAVIHIFNQA